jgi:hypothetical protein
MAEFDPSKPYDDTPYVPDGFTPSGKITFLGAKNPNDFQLQKTQQYYNSFETQKTEQQLIEEAREKENQERLKKILKKQKKNQKSSPIKPPPTPAPPSSPSSSPPSSSPTPSIIPSSFLSSSFLTSTAPSSSSTPLSSITPTTFSVITSTPTPSSAPPPPSSSSSSSSTSAPTPLKIDPKATIKISGPLPTILFEPLHKKDKRIPDIEALFKEVPFLTVSSFNRFSSFLTPDVIVNIEDRDKDYILHIPPQLQHLVMKPKTPTEVDIYQRSLIVGCELINTRQMIDDSLFNIFQIFDLMENKFNGLVSQVDFDTQRMTTAQAISDLEDAIKKIDKNVDFGAILTKYHTDQIEPLLNGLNTVINSFNVWQNVVEAHSGELIKVRGYDKVIADVNDFLNNNKDISKQVETNKTDIDSHKKSIDELLKYKTDSFNLSQALNNQHKALKTQCDEITKSYNALDPTKLINTNAEAKDLATKAWHATTNLDTKIAVVEKNNTVNNQAVADLRTYCENFTKTQTQPVVKVENHHLDEIVNRVNPTLASTVQTAIDKFKNTQDQLFNKFKSEITIEKEDFKQTNADLQKHIKALEENYSIQLDKLTKDEQQNYITTKDTLESHLATLIKNTFNNINKNLEEKITNLNNKLNNFINNVNKNLTSIEERLISVGSPSPKKSDDFISETVKQEISPRNKKKKSQPIHHEEEEDPLEQKIPPKSHSPPKEKTPKPDVYQQGPKSQLPPPQTTKQSSRQSSADKKQPPKNTK